MTGYRVMATHLSALQQNMFIRKTTVIFFINIIPTINGKLVFNITSYKDSSDINSFKDKKNKNQE